MTSSVDSVHSQTTYLTPAKRYRGTIPQILYDIVLCSMYSISTGFVHAGLLAGWGFVSLGLLSCERVFFNTVSWA